jgi:hypothetical protein
MKRHKPLKRSPFKAKLPERKQREESFSGVDDPLVGRVFSYWTVLRTFAKDSKYRVATCQCSCGTTRDVRVASLKNGKSQSCGCYRIVVSTETILRVRTTHGRTHSRLYRIWRGIVTRTCNDKHHEYHRYGGRGIFLCPEWRISFEAFAAGVGEPPTDKHTIERIDNDRGYDPGNVRWATYAEQARNRSNNVWVLVDGREKLLTEAARDLGIHRGSVYRMAERGEVTILPRGRYGANDRHAPQPKNEPVRDEAYRRWVATLPCIRCGVHGRSQAAHPNFGKGMSQKTSDLDCFPLCAPTVNYMGCHMAHDLSFGMTRDERRQRELDYIAAMKTMRELLDPLK